jgi:PadR family transcriptional regulator, regulatory protein PadR
MRYNIVSYVFIYIGYTIYNLVILRKMVYNDNNYCCDMRGMLGFLILFLLSKKPMNGQEIADEIANRKGERPSPGTIYPALKSLRLMGFIDIEEKEGKTISYNLTERGKKALKVAKRRFARTFLGVFP